MDNPFEALAGQLTSPAKAKIRAAEKRAAMKPTAQEQESINKRRQLRLHNKWRRERVMEHLARPYTREFRELKAVLQGLTITSGPHLVAYVRQKRWLKTAPYMTRAIVLSLIDASISRLRIRNGLAPIDDSLPGEEPSTFELIRDELDCFKTEPVACP